MRTNVCLETSAPLDDFEPTTEKHLIGQRSFLDWEIDANHVFGLLWPHTSDFQNPAATTCPAVSQATARSTRAFVVSSKNVWS
jgi:hypothetical protein